MRNLTVVQGYLLFDVPAALSAPVYDSEHKLVDIAIPPEQRWIASVSEYVSKLRRRDRQLLMMVLAGWERARIRVELGIRSDRGYRNRIQRLTELAKSTIISVRS